MVNQVLLFRPQYPPSKKINSAWQEQMDFSVVYMAGRTVASSNDAANKLPFILCQ